MEIERQGCENAMESIEHVVEKAKFWDKHRESTINERQTKVLNMILNTCSKRTYYQKIHENDTNNYGYCFTRHQGFVRDEVH